MQFVRTDNSKFTNSVNFEWWLKKPRYRNWLCVQTSPSN